VTIEAAHDGFRRLPGSPLHRRGWSLTTSELRVDDEVTGSGTHAVTVRWYLAPGTPVWLDGRLVGPAGEVTSGGTSATAVVCTGANASISISFDVSASCPLRLAVESAPVAIGFSRTTTAPVLACRMNADLPVRVTTRWRREAGLPAIGEAEEVA